MCHKTRASINRCFKTPVKISVIYSKLSQTLGLFEEPLSKKNHGYLLVYSNMSPIAGKPNNVFYIATCA